MLHNVPEIVEVVSSADANKILHLDEQDEEQKVKSALRSTFTKLMLASKETIMGVISEMKSRLHMESQVSWRLSVITDFPFLEFCMYVVSLLCAPTCRMIILSCLASEKILISYCNLPEYYYVIKTSIMFDPHNPR